MDKSIKNKLFKYLPYILLLGLYIFNIANMLKYGKNNLDSDMSSEMLLANIMNEDHDFLFCKNWAYSTEIRIIYLQLAFRIGLLIFPNNWYYARVFGMAIMMLILILAFLHLSNTLKLDKYGVWMTLVLIAPFSDEYYEMVCFGGSYLPHLIIYILITDLLIMYKNNKSKLIMFFLIILGLIGGISGVRIVYNYAFPLFTVSFISMLLTTKNKNIKDIIVNYITEYKSVFIELCSIILGYIINYLILKNIYTFADYTGIEVSLFSLYYVVTIFVHIFQLFGWSNVGTILSGNNLLSAFSLGYILMFILTFAWSIKNIRKFVCKETNVYFMWLILIPITFIECIIVFGLFGQNHPRYWIPIVPFSLVYFALFFKYSNIKENIKKLMLVSFLLCIVLTSVNTIKTFRSNSNDTKRQEALNYLMNNNLTQGYSSFWSGNVLVELSNGELEIWTSSNNFSDLSTYTVFNWLQDTRHFENEPTDNKVFLIIGVEDSIDTSNIDSYKVFDNDNYQIYKFDDYNKIKQFMNTRTVS